jgi:uncharacterized phage infection (PIP) family protein YhgE
MALADEVMSMQKSMSDDEVIRTLAEKGYSPLEISEAFNQAKLKQSGSKELMPSIMQQEQSQQEIPAPSPMQAPAPQQPGMEEAAAAYYPYQYPTQPQFVQQQPQQKADTEMIEELVEEIINEKWQEFKTKVGDIGEWKMYMESKIKSVDDRLKRMELSFDRLQATLLGKVHEYTQNIKDVGVEVQSLENAFSKVLDPLITNIKELSKLTEHIKKTQPASKSKK